jgi:hypothetical protein
VAEDDELRTLILGALDTQVQAEMPLAYHLVNVPRQILHVSARLKFEIPLPNKELVQPISPENSNHSDNSWAAFRHLKLTEEWLPRFTQHAMMVVANRNVHRHMGSCLSGIRRETGCRFNAPWGHDVDTTRCVQLFIHNTDVLEPERIEFRCLQCHADGAMRDTTSMPETNARTIAETDQKRDLYYTAGKVTPRAEVGEDVRVLQIDLKRSLLPSLDSVKLELAFNDSTDNIGGLRNILETTITGNTVLADLLKAPELQIVRDRLGRK